MVSISKIQLILHYVFLEYFGHVLCLLYPQGENIMTENKWEIERMLSKYVATDAVCSFHGD